MYQLHHLWYVTTWTLLQVPEMIKIISNIPSNVNKHTCWSQLHVKRIWRNFLPLR